MLQKLQNEIIHGKYIANAGEQIWNWSSPAGKIRWKRRVDMFKKFIGNNNNYILEVGCGTGLFTQQISKTKNKFLAIDISPDLLKIARRNIDDKNVSFKIGNAYQTSFKPNSFDFIIGSSILHHLDIDLALNEFFRILKPGGKIIFTEPNHLNPQIALERSSPYFRKLFNNSPDETAFIRWKLIDQLKTSGFTNIKVTPFDFLHPATPSILIKFIYPLSRIIENVPILKEFSGSLVVTANK
jgi:ubiquinone/menaquinone biosynthesis C-methylase UbiE